MQEDRVSFPSPGEAPRSGEAGDRGRARPEPGGFTGLSAAAVGETLSPVSSVAFRNASLAGSPLGRRVGRPFWALGDSASGQLCPLGVVEEGGRAVREPLSPQQSLRPWCWQACDCCCRKSRLCARVCLGPRSEVSRSCDPLRDSRTCLLPQKPVEAWHQEGRVCAFCRAVGPEQGLGWGPAGRVGSHVRSGRCCQALRSLRFHTVEPWALM